MTFMDYIGLVGGIALSYSNIPQILLFIKQKNARGISKVSTWFWLIGLILKFVYSVHTTGYNMIILWPYGLALICCTLTLWYCYFPGEKNEKEKT